MPQQQNEEHFSRLEIQLYIVQDPWFQSQILRSVLYFLETFFFNKRTNSSSSVVSSS